MVSDRVDSTRSLFRKSHSRGPERGFRYVYVRTMFEFEFELRPILLSYTTRRLSWHTDHEELEEGVEVGEFECTRSFDLSDRETLTEREKKEPE